MRDATKANEDYLEAILMLEKQGGKIKSVMIANHLSVSKPAVNKAMNELKDCGWIEKSNYGDVSLTKRGRDLAQNVYKKHLLVKNFLIKLGVSEDTANIECCKIEHLISDETIACMKTFIEEKNDNT